MDNSPCIEVRCGVKNCDYNKSNVCHAQGLMVNTQGDGFANSVEGTCCETFKSMS